MKLGTSWLCLPVSIPRWKIRPWQYFIIWRFVEKTHSPKIPHLSTTPQAAIYASCWRINQFTNVWIRRFSVRLNGKSCTIILHPVLLTLLINSSVNFRSSFCLSGIKFGQRLVWFPSWSELYYEVIHRPPDRPLRPHPTAAYYQIITASLAEPFRGSSLS